MILACSVNDCGRPRLARRRGDRVTYYSMCGGHRNRFYKFGDVHAGGPLKPRAANGEGWINPGGYWRYSLPSHPTAGSQGHVFHHRVVLYDSLGPGSHPCHWCAALVDWDAPHPNGLEVDHLDGNKLNNELSNLVPTCHGCNISRRHAGNPINWKVTA